MARVAVSGCILPTTLQHPCQSTILTMQAAVSLMQLQRISKNHFLSTVYVPPLKKEDEAAEVVNSVRLRRVIASLGRNGSPLMLYLSRYDFNTAG
jgi:hypothetical protein